jgi:hypothetical protein
MVPLYAARVQDLGTGDYVVFKCGACGHTAELPPSALMRGLGLKPTDKVLDLERRLRCPTVPRQGSGRRLREMAGDELSHNQGAVRLAALRGRTEPWRLANAVS